MRGPCPEPPPCEPCPDCPTPSATPPTSVAPVAFVPKANGALGQAWQPGVHRMETFINTDRTLSDHTRRATAVPELAAAFERFADVQKSITSGIIINKHRHSSTDDDMDIHAWVGMRVVICR